MKNTKTEQMCQIILIKKIGLSKAFNQQANEQKCNLTD